jgi:hypothetical protein
MILSFKAIPNSGCHSSKKELKIGEKHPPRRPFEREKHLSKERRSGHFFPDFQVLFFFTTYIIPVSVPLYIHLKFQNISY